MSSQAWEDLGQLDLTVTGHDTIRLVAPKRFPQIDESRLQLSRRLDVYNLADGVTGEDADAAVRLIDSLDSRTLQGQPLRPRIQPAKLELEPDRQLAEPVVVASPQLQQAASPSKQSGPKKATPKASTTAKATTRPKGKRLSTMVALLLLVVAIGVLGFMVWTKFLM